VTGTGAGPYIEAGSGMSQGPLTATWRAVTAKPSYGGTGNVTVTGPDVAWTSSPILIQGL
jgi:hypothetical protein